MVNKNLQVRNFLFHSIKISSAFIRSLYKCWKNVTCIKVAVGVISIHWRGIHYVNSIAWLQYHVVNVNMLVIEPGYKWGWLLVAFYAYIFQYICRDWNWKHIATSTCLYVFFRMNDFNKSKFYDWSSSMELRPSL